MLNGLCEMWPTRPLETTVIFAFLFVAAEAYAGTELDFWHSYVHQPDGVSHFSFHIAKYKRGLFFGSCGPSTKSLQWEYEVDLAGSGPVYKKEQIAITVEGKKLELTSGTINLDTKQRRATIDLRIEIGDSTTNFIANGIYEIKRLKSVAIELNRNVMLERKGQNV